jgi:hypothetical protein
MMQEVIAMANVKMGWPTKVPELLELGRRVVSSIGESPHFAEPPPALSSARRNVAAATEKLQNAENEARVGGSQKKQYRNLVKVEYLEALKSLARQVEAFADGDVNILKSSGFPVRDAVPNASRSRTGLGVPVCTVEPGSAPGSWLAKWKAGRSALGIEAQIAEGDPTVAENWRHYGFFPHTSQAQITGLTSSQNYSFRFRALNGTDQGPWSPIHTVTPQ